MEEIKVTITRLPHWTYLVFSTEDIDTEAALFKLVEVIDLIQGYTTQTKQVSKREWIITLSSPPA